MPNLNVFIFIGEKKYTQSISLIEYDCEQYHTTQMDYSLSPLYVKKIKIH